MSGMLSHRLWLPGIVIAGIVATPSQAQLTASASGLSSVLASGAYGQQTITVTENTVGASWSISTPSWIQLETSSGGQGTYHIYYIIAENNGGARPGSVVVSDGVNPNVTLTFNQSAYPATFNDTLSAPNVTANYNSGVVTVTSSATYAGGSDGGGGGFITFVLQVGYGNWGTNGCEIRYVPFWNLVYLADDQGDKPWAQWVSPAPWQSGGAISNSQCSFGPSDITVNVPGDTTASITVNVHLAANSGQDPTGFVGNVAVYPFVYAVGYNGNVGQNPSSPMSVTQVKGPPLSSGPGQPIRVGGNEFQFQMTYSDPTGSAYLDDLILSINNGDSVQFPNCQIMAWRPWSGNSWGANWNTWDDNGNLTGNTSNSQCTLNTGKSSFHVNSDDTTITVVEDITFSGSFAQPGTDLWAWTITSDWNDQAPAWVSAGGPWPEGQILTEYIRMGSSAIAMETSAVSGSGGPGAPGQSLPASAQSRRSKPVHFRIGPSAGVPR